MVFNSLTFLIFFAAVLAFHYSPASWRSKKVVLLLASYVFYAAWNPPFILLLWLTTVVDFYAARAMARREGRRRRLFLYLTLAGNLGMLSYFKYGGFILENFTAAAGALGVEYRPAQSQWVLPVGISFYIFESLSYGIDVYKKRLEPTRSLLDYALFVGFFPHLVAGPIVRAKDFLHQLSAEKRADVSQFSWGLALLAVGLFEKTVLADSLLAPVADRLYAKAELLGFSGAWVGTLAFSGQIFFDFAGYSTCAIGTAKMLGLVLMKNFNYPYAAVGFSDFWQRWHISLSTWLRDYLYIDALGGNKGSAAKTYRNLMLTMLLGGLWHGAAWRFIVWGGLHGFYLVAEKYLRERFARRANASAVTGVAALPVGERGAVLLPRWLAPLFLTLLTYGLVCVTWVFFRAKDLPTSLKTVAAMFGLKGGEAAPAADAALVISLTAVMLAAHRALKDTDLVAVAQRWPWVARALALAAIVVAVTFALLSGDDRAFIYFQF